MEDTKGMVIKLGREEQAKLKEIQARYILIGLDKTMAQIAQDCLKIGIHEKLLNTMTYENNL